MESSINKTNKEVLEWSKKHLGKSQRALLDEAKTFFGTFVGSKERLHKLIVKSRDENKKRKRKAHSALMKECGGGGKEGSIPPEEYVPDCFQTDFVCKICEKSFDDTNELKEHAKYNHQEYLKICWSKDALENIYLYEEYKSWLEHQFEIDFDDSDNKNVEMSSQISSINSPQTIIKVSQKGNIIQAQRETITCNKNGTIKRSILNEQYANISKRKHDNDENEDPNKPKKRTKHQSQGINEILEHMSGGNMEVKSSILSEVIDAQGPDIAACVVKNSKELKQKNKL